MKEVAEKAVLMLLESMFQPDNRGATDSFYFGEIGSPTWARRLGTSIYYDELLLLEVVLFLRQNGPPYLRNMRPNSIRSLLMEFISEYYSLLANDCYLRKFYGSYLSEISESTKRKLVESFRKSTIFIPPELVTIYPLDVINVSSPFDADQFFLVDAGDLSRERLPENVDYSDIESSSHPPSKSFDVPKQSPKSWLGIRSPNSESALRLRNIILGAVALLPMAKHRYLFSRRKLTNGWCEFGANGGITYGELGPSTPALYADLDLASEDHNWLAILARLSDTSSGSAISETRALEYFYRAWFSNESERYASLYMALESVLGDAGGTTQAVVDEVREILGDHIPANRIKTLSQLRAALIHGGAPEVYDSSKYLKYYRNYKADPVRDLELLTAECLRKRIFGEALTEKPDPHQDIIDKAIKSGRMPPPNTNSILSNNSRQDQKN